MTTEYYETFGGVVLAFVGDRGSEGVCSFRAGEGTWHYEPWGSKAWDAWHQEVYRNFRADVVDAPPVPLPPLPEITAQSWASNFQPEAELRDGPLVEYVRDAQGGQITVFYVVQEDKYESLMGDGCVVAACFQAQRFAEVTVDPTGSLRSTPPWRDSERLSPAKSRCRSNAYFASGGFG
jgi:hypothetical protein